MRDALRELKLRGFFQQCTDENNLDQLLKSKSITFYAGFDPTNISLHLGHLVPIMGMALLQRMGHRAIALIGGGTAMIGDPTGKIEARKILSLEEIENNTQKIKLQLEKFLKLDGNQGILLNNADWLRNINYIEFLRDIGRHFSVNRMLSFETYKEKMKHGLSFLEFNYILLQSYDFLQLFRKYNCILQIGGDDQWANMLSGVELIRRIEHSKDVECLTFPLILTSEGKKMGKTEKGAIFLSEELTSVFDFYQYWINVTDDDVIRFLKLYTFLPLEEIAKYEKLKYEELREAKQVLAFEVTKIVHGEEAAIEAKKGALAAFEHGEGIDFMPFIELSYDTIRNGISVLDLFVKSGLCESKSEVRRLIQQHGCKINDQKISDEKLIVDKNFLTEKGIILRSGKKKVCRVVIK